jgi:hypothetical protein
MLNSAEEQFASFTQAPPQAILSRALNSLNKCSNVFWPVLSEEKVLVTIVPLAPCSMKHNSSVAEQQSFRKYALRFILATPADKEVLLDWPEPFSAVTHGLLRLHMLTILHILKACKGSCIPSSHDCRLLICGNWRRQLTQEIVGYCPVRAELKWETAV